jgi:hypothetical protein
MKSEDFWFEYDPISSLNKCNWQGEEAVKEKEWT